MNVVSGWGRTPVLSGRCSAAHAGKPCSPTFRDGLATDLVTDAVLKSAKTRQWESIPAAQVKVA